MRPLTLAFIVLSLFAIIRPVISTTNPVCYNYTMPDPNDKNTGSDDPEDRPPSSGHGCTEYHTVKQGEIAFLIATKRGLLLSELQKYNPGVKLDSLTIGQKLCMNRIPQIPPSNPDGTAKVVKSKKDQKCSDIAKENGLSNKRFEAINIGKSCEGRLAAGISFFVTRGTDPECKRFHTIVEGDSSIAIAATNKLTMTQLQTINPGWPLDPIFPDNRLCVYARGIGSPTATTTTPQPPAPSATPVICTQEYTVVSGDFVFKIATDRGMILAEIRALNPGIADLNVIIPGQKICLNQAGAIPPSNPDGLAKVVQVKGGETCESVATQNKITLSVFQILNKETKCNAPIPSGQTVFVTRGLSPSCKKFATIVAGDTAGSIATANNNTLDKLQTLNPGLSTTVIFAGLRFCVAN